MCIPSLNLVFHNNKKGNEKKEKVNEANLWWAAQVFYILEPK